MFFRHGDSSVLYAINEFASDYLPTVLDRADDQPLNAMLLGQMQLGGEAKRAVNSLVALDVDDGPLESYEAN